MASARQILCAAFGHSVDFRAAVSFRPVSLQKGRAAEAARPLFLLSAVAAAACAAAAAGAADALSAGLLGTVDCVARAAQDGGDDQNDDQIHIT